MIIKKIYLFFFIITLITFSYKNIFAAPLCLEEDINLENKEVTSNEESSKEKGYVVETWYLDVEGFEKVGLLD